ncbi:hypothetical protein B0I35DRAFT_476753 [Stachybotrys elegans]|uniref:Uncharacterized protein n=1 Tax=Stachybotrys elegans TaxID=80388 RepID=A0A8K0WTI3_9HYPO|nr:hypothetical protein B0I35DRAFT_476753 [Stachybotrys elegans]
MSLQKQPSHNPDHPEQLRAHLSTYFDQRITFDFSKLKYSEAYSLAKTQSIIRRLVNDYASTAQWKMYRDEPPFLGWRETYQGKPLLKPLTDSEMSTFERAFYRYEMYCRAFQIFPKTSRRRSQDSDEPGDHEDRDYPVKMQAKYFLARMAPFEVEEMACVHEYLMMRLSEVLDVAEEDVRTKIRCTGNRPDSLLAELPDDCWTLNDVISGGLTLLCSSTRCRSYEVLGYFASIGLEYCDKIIFASTYADGFQEMRIIGPSSRKFLPEAVEYAIKKFPVPPAPGAAAPGHSVYINAPAPSYGFTEFQDVDIYPYLPVIYPKMLNVTARRHLAWVFWDKESVEHPDPYLAINDAGHIRPGQPRAPYDRCTEMGMDLDLYGMWLPDWVGMLVIEKWGDLRLVSRMQWRYDF